MISKELLSEVLNVKVISIEVYTNGVDYYEEHGSTIHINIHELTHKCKEWALTQNYIIKSFISDKGYAIIETKVGKDEIIDLKISNTEPEAIFKACQWILENKETNEIPN